MRKTKSIRKSFSEVGISRRDLRFLGTALKESAKSTYFRVRIGAVLARGNYLISKGANLSTSHPLQRTHNDAVGRIAPAHALHAEMNAIVKAKGEDLRGSTIYVARLDRRGALGMCRPCSACERALRDRGVSRVVYTSPDGVREEFF